MILVDTSVWIDVLASRDTPQADAFQQMLKDRQVIGVADLVAVEILQGMRSERDFASTLDTLRDFAQVNVVDADVAVRAARNYRFLRSRGITVRKTIDTLIATRCIADNLPLLYSDRDFDPFVEHLGLRSALDLPIGPS